MKPTLEITGAAEWRTKLKRMGPEAFAAMVAGGYQAFEEIMTRSKEEYVPVDQGTLRSTGHVEPPTVTGMRAEITMGYGGPAAPYALAVHENPRAGKTGGLSPSGKPYDHWARTGGWKYLETPLKEATGSIAEKIKARVEAAQAGLK